MAWDQGLGFKGMGRGHSGYLFPELFTAALLANPPEHSTLSWIYVPGCWA